MAENLTLALSFHCSQSRPALLVSIIYSSVRTVIVLPCAVAVLHLGRRRRRRSSGPTSHADAFTYNVVLFDLLFVAGFLLFLCGSFGLLQTKMVGFYLSLVSFPGPVLLHIAACLERYLAVAHPVTYLALRRSGGTRIRDVVLVCVWVLCCGWSAGGTETLNPPFLPTFLLLGLALLIVTFSSLRVLRVLIRPKPGQGRRSGQGSKLRAFQTMTAITGTMWMWFLGVLVSLALSTDHSQVDGCVLLVCGYWFTLPSNLVLPLLFLHRARRLPGPKCKN